MKQRAIYFFFILLIGATSCSNDDDGALDNAAPTVSDATLNDASEDIIVEPNSTMHFDAQFVDDVLLGQYKVDIHNNFNGHSHGRVAADPFIFSQVYSLIGKTETVHEDIEIPEDAAHGPYHFTLQFFDAAGNEGEIVVLDFEIADPANQPIVTVTSPDLSSEIELAPGGSLTLVGTVNDPDGLEEVHIILASEDDDHDHGRFQEEVLFEEEFILEGAESWNFEAVGPIEIPEGAAPGHYELSITAEDLLGNRKTISAEVHVE